MRKSDFPIFKSHLGLIYLDSAATSLTPKPVIAAVTEYLEKFSANISRGLYPLAEETTERFEAVRNKTARFLNAESKEVIFTSGTTASLNLTARLLEEGLTNEDEIIVTEMEHHSNFLPWKELAQRTGARFTVLPLTKTGEISLEVLKKAVGPKTKALALSSISNVLGTINPIQEITSLAKEKNPNIVVVVDAAQAVGHISVDVKVWGVDFVAFSSHKMFGSTGLGVLYGKKELLETLSPVDFGGGMVLDACAPKTTYRDIPYRFEAGTPDIAAVFALGAALDYIEEVGLPKIREHEVSLTQYAREQLASAFGERIQVLGPISSEKRGGILAFNIKGLHPHDMAQILGEEGICIRAGEHCAAPLHRSLGLTATTRVSFSIYNEKEDIDVFIRELKSAEKILVK